VSFCASSVRFAACAWSVVTKTAIGAKPEVWEPVEQAVFAAVQADAAARAHLFGPRPRLARH
jgi:hypothetical protein